MARACMLVCILGLLLLLGACDNPKRFHDPLTPIDVKAGEEFSIAIWENPSVGYKSNLAEPVDSNLIVLVADTTRPDHNDNRPGSSDTHIWTFKSVSAGGTTVKFNNYYRDFKNPKDQSIFTISIR